MTSKIEYYIDRKSLQDNCYLYYIEGKALTIKLEVNKCISYDPEEWWGTKRLYPVSEEEIKKAIIVGSFKFLDLNNRTSVENFLFSNEET